MFLNRDRFFYNRFTIDTCFSFCNLFKTRFIWHRKYIHFGWTFRIHLRSVASVRVDKDDTQVQRIGCFWSKQRSVSFRRLIDKENLFLSQRTTSPLVEEETKSTRHFVSPSTTLARLLRWGRRDRTSRTRRWCNQWSHKQTGPNRICRSAASMSATNKRKYGSETFFKIEKTYQIDQSNVDECAGCDWKYPYPCVFVLGDRHADEEADKGCASGEEIEE